MTACGCVYSCLSHSRVYDSSVPPLVCDSAERSSLERPWLQRAIQLFMFTQEALDVQSSEKTSNGIPVVAYRKCVVVVGTVVWLFVKKKFICSLSAKSSSGSAVPVFCSRWFYRDGGYRCSNRASVGESLQRHEACRVIFLFKSCPEF